MDAYDLIVIGSGPAGERGAEEAARYGKHVALVEREEYLGGAGINTGTVPSKTLRETALFYSGLKHRDLYGIDYSLKGDLSVKEFMHREHIVVANERKQVTQKIDSFGIQRLRGEASFRDAHSIAVKNAHGEKVVQGDLILVATGSSPYDPPEIPFDGKLVFDSDTILHLTRIPRTMVVLGGGVIGTEYASIFAALGVKVTLVEARDRILGFVDSEIMDCLRRDLEQIGVKLGERGLVLANEHYQTNIPNIYAAGDVIGFPALAATSREQARVAMVYAFGKDHEERLSPVLPFAVYAIPEISMVGKTEAACKEKKIPYVIGRGHYADNARGQIIGDMSGMVKLVISPSDRKLLGVHIIGEEAAELIHIGSELMMQDGSIDDFIHAVYNYPTLSDNYKAAALDGRNQLEARAQQQAAKKP